MISEQQIDLAIEKLFGELTFTATPAGLYDPLRYMIEIGGKRIRPRLCILAYSLFKDSLTEDILRPAAALEVFHSFTLIHDDIMDNAPVRRGVPTVWKKWGENQAILSGDSMCIESYRLLSGCPAEALPKVLKLFSDTAAQVCDGQQYDMEFEERDSVEMDEYMMMIGLKTAVLIACAAKMGALVAGASASDADLLYRYGYSLGLAFQVADDYLDTFGDQSVFGKAIGGDIVNNKKSWLLTRAYADPALRERLDAALLMSIDTEDAQRLKIETVRNIYMEAGVGEAAKAEIIRLHNEALEYAAALNIDAEGHSKLEHYAKSLLGRAK